MCGLSFNTLCLLFAAALAAAVGVLGADQYNRADFPADFVFGSGTTAYQYEGAAFEDGRTPGVWDTYSHSDRYDGANGDVTCDGYHKYKEDIKLMSDMGLEAFRISISWSRLIPNGRGPVNPLGLQFYNNFINELIGHGIQPHVALHHADLPQVLEDEYDGWISRKIVKDFTAYADVCFREFGDRVLYWTTVNEANIFAIGGYDQGVMPPGRCSKPFSNLCSKGNSTSEPYLVGHNILLAHSAVVKLYTEKYKATQKGYIGFNIYNLWMVPYSNSKEDAIATQRANDFYTGWLLDPLIFGDYPEIVKKNAGTRIPGFTKDELEQIKGAIDFIGVNHYTTILVKDYPAALQTPNRDLIADMAVELKMVVEKKPPLPLPDHEYPVRPWGLYGLLEYVKQVYGNPPVYVHENGQKKRRNQTLDDTTRVDYLNGYIGATLDAVRNGSNTKGYFAWSLLDCLELLDGFDSSFGMCYVDLDDKDLKRYPKHSARWYSKFLNGALVCWWITCYSVFCFGILESLIFLLEISDGSGANGDVTCGGHHKYKDDGKLMSEMGLEAFRISISWSRLIPNGRGPVDPLGLQFYNNFINELISHGIQPRVTLHHLDHPQALEDEYGGWLSRNIVKDFAAYADVCFREFGDRVLYWTTINEASIFAIGGYDQGISPPGRCSPPFSYGCSKGNSSIEPYIVGITSCWLIQLLRDCIRKNTRPFKKVMLDL